MNRDDIKFLALQELGVSDRPDFTDFSINEVKVVNTQYDFVMSLALSKYNWTFAQGKTSLSQIDDTDTQYKYKYLLPDNFLFLRGCFSDNSYQSPINDYEVYDGYIHTNSSDVYIVYTKRVCEESLPPYFVNYLRYLLARMICTLITGDTNLLQQCVSNEQKEELEARNVDLRQKPTSFMDTGTFINMRN